MKPETYRKLDAFTKAYIAAALWSSNDDADEPLDRNYGCEDIDELSALSMIADCEEFQRLNAPALAEFYEYRDEGRAGHCFWLNRNGHGSGFWDEYCGERGAMAEELRRIGETLSEACKKFPTSDLMTCDPSDAIDGETTDEQTPGTRILCVSPLSTAPKATAETWAQYAQRVTECHDDGEAVGDPLTVVFLNQPKASTADPYAFACVGLSGHSTAHRGEHLGRRVKFADLPGVFAHRVLIELGMPATATPNDL